MCPETALFSYHVAYPKLAALGPSIGPGEKRQKCNKRNSKLLHIFRTLQKACDTKLQSFVN